MLIKTLKKSLKAKELLKKEFVKPLQVIMTIQKKRMVKTVTNLVLPVPRVPKLLASLVHGRTQLLRIRAKVVGSTVEKLIKANVSQLMNSIFQKNTLMNQVVKNYTPLPQKVLTKVTQMIVINHYLVTRIVRSVPALLPTVPNVTTPLI